MSRYQAYPEYRESGVQWLDNLPKHWGVKRTKKMFSLTRELVGKKSSEYQLLSLTLRGVIHRDISDGSGKIPAEFDTYQVVRPDNLIFCLFDIEETPRTVGLSTDHGMITGAYNVYICSDECHPKYAYYYFMHIDSFKGLQPFYTGLRKVVRAETFANIEMPAPSISEQWQITKFLDHETAKIDALIEKQQRLIELLKEKRQAVISHAVTKGLNPNAPMKDSGVEWLGEVPAHWIVLQLRRVLTGMEQGKSPECESRPADLNEWGVLKTGCVNNGAFNFNENKFLPEHIAPFSQFEVKNGDVLMSRASGSVDLIGSVAYVNNPREKLLLSDKIFRLRFEPSVHKIFFTRLMQSSYMRSNIKVEISGAEGMANNITKSSINSFRFALPPFEEQVSIAQAIEKKVLALDRLIQRSVSGIDLLQERRTALISAAVTGKIDVRDWQAAA